MKTLLIYPRLGSLDAFITYPPLSLIYAACDAVKAQKEIEILDLRFHPNNYLDILKKKMTPAVKLVGISVMTGSPINYALKISQFLKINYQVKIVWGGAHPTLLPEETLENAFVDFVIQGYGSKALAALINALEKRGSLEHVPNLYYKKKGKKIANTRTHEHELIPHKDLPYDLVDMERYFAKTLGNRDIPIFTSLGCPHQCTFCISPAIFTKMKKKWVPYDLSEIIQHIKRLHAQYQVTSITVLDDDSFVNLNRIAKLFKAFINTGLSQTIKMNFRGARIDELDQMSLKDMVLMAKANTGFIMIGIESGSQKMLDRMKKGFSVETIKRVNKKLACYPEIRPHYNFFVGTPGETINDLICTKDLLLKLMEDHPGCYLGFGSDWKPIPGSEMTKIAQREYMLKIPVTLEEWAQIDSFDAHSKIYYPWYTDEYDKFIRMLQCSAGILDRKFYQEFILDQRIFFKILSILSLLYRPVSIWRLKHSVSKFLIEFPIRNWLFNSIFKRL